MSAIDIIYYLTEIVWGTPMLVTIMAIGFLFTARSKFFSFTYIGHMLKETLGKIISKEAHNKSHGGLSPFEAVAIAIGSAVGVGNISGVATAIATGGPGSVFWMWLWALFGMTVKSAEVALGCYFRSRDNEGNYYGGPTFYMEKGLGQVKGYKWWKIFTWGFFLSMMVGCLGGSQTYTIAESISSAFNLPILPVTFVFCLFVIVIIYKGVTSIASFATKVVPFMCCAYVIGCGVIVCMNAGEVPHVIGMIFHDAFTGTAALGGFTGATLSKVVSIGVARSINSNEAGMGGSPFAHASADTPHPIRQSLWGSFEVFVDTIIICSMTSLAILCSGVWSSGVSGASLAIAAFETSFGFWGGKVVAISIFLFGLTTITGWFAYYDVMLRQLMQNKPEFCRKFMTVFKIVYNLPGLYVVYLAVAGGDGPVLIWAMSDLLNAFPTFFNCITILLLMGTYLELLKDYKARYLGVGTVDPNFKIFYDTPPIPKEETAPVGQAKEE